MEQVNIIYVAAAYLVLLSLTTYFYLRYRSAAAQLARIASTQPFPDIEKAFSSKRGVAVALGITSALKKSAKIMVKPGKILDYTEDVDSLDNMSPRGVNNLRESSIEHFKHLTNNDIQHVIFQLVIARKISDPQEAAEFYEEITGGGIQDREDLHRIVSALTEQDDDPTTLS